MSRFVLTCTCCDSIDFDVIYVDDDEQGDLFDNIIQCRNCKNELHIISQYDLKELKE